MDGSRVSSMSQWWNSDVFIVFVVVLLLIIVAIFAFCWIKRRRPVPTETLAEIEIIPLDNLGKNNQPRFTLMIIMEQKHASELVQTLTCRSRSIVHQSCSSVTAEIASTSRDQPRAGTSSSCHDKTDKTLCTGLELSSLENMQIPSTATNTVTNEEVNDNSESETTWFQCAS
ncbi:uncharacterized protein si:dkey-111e8.4 [Trichomycterus rosablanca]|uniref:uncharacterized protein si:dkey-111e8.4 n=1 Tax=Trichomycterus rosablanca TaxID=2290929 RepID=UPI002F359BBD